jgi:hypothetical protein
MNYGSDGENSNDSDDGVRNFFSLFLYHKQLPIRTLFIISPVFLRGVRFFSVQQLLAFSLYSSDIFGHIVFVLAKKVIFATYLIYE